MLGRHRGLEQVSARHLFRNTPVHCTSHLISSVKKSLTVGDCDNREICKPDFTMFPKTNKTFFYRFKVLNVSCFSCTKKE